MSTTGDFKVQIEKLEGRDDGLNGNADFNASACRLPRRHL